MNTLSKLTFADSKRFNLLINDIFTDCEQEFVKVYIYFYMCAKETMAKSVTEVTESFFNDKICCLF